MDRVIRGLEHKIALAYLDDIIVYGASIDDCLEHLLAVFERLRTANLKLKAKKCMLFATEVNYLGYVITSHGVRTDPKKVEAITKWHPPNTVKSVRSFLGLVQYYSKFIRNFSDVCRPLYNLTRKNVTFEWTPECQEAFDTIKELMVKAPILAYPKAVGRFILDTDASKYAYGGVLSQMQYNEHLQKEEERPGAFVSKNFTDTERLYCTRKRELFAIKSLVKYFNVYLRGQTFTIRTDHASLQYLKTLKELPDHFQRWILDLEEYSYKIEIRKGSLHSNADAMSRGCHGKECICKQVFKWESSKRLKPGDKLLNNVFGMRKFSANNLKFEDDLSVVAVFKRQSKWNESRKDQVPICETCMDNKHFDNECVVNAFKLRPHYSLEELAEQQKDFLMLVLFTSPLRRTLRFNRNRKRTRTGVLPLRLTTSSGNASSCKVASYTDVGIHVMVCETTYSYSYRGNCSENCWSAFMTPRT
jgi:hypothetical protein